MSVQRGSAPLLVDSGTSEKWESVGSKYNAQNFALNQSPSVLSLFLLFRIFELFALDSALIQATEVSL